jgi:hypothetical protein
VTVMRAPFGPGESRRPTPLTVPRWIRVMTHPHHDVLVALVQRSRLRVAVPAALALVELDPLASAGLFGGDLVRGLMEVPGSFWVRHPLLFARYRAALRACAVERRALPPEHRLDFWAPLSLDSAYLDRGHDDDSSTRGPGD